MIRQNAIAYSFEAGDREKILQVLNTEGGQILIDVITDQIVTNPDLDAMESRGAGRVLSLMRSIRNDTGLETPK